MGTMNAKLVSAPRSWVEVELAAAIANFNQLPISMRGFSVCKTDQLTRSVVWVAAHGQGDFPLALRHFTFQQRHITLLHATRNKLLLQALVGAAGEGKHQQS